MTHDIWTTFMERLTQEGKLDEFCALADVDIDTWLEDNDMGVTMDQLVAASPRFELTDTDLDQVAGGKVTIHSLQSAVKQEANRWFSSKNPPC